VDDAGQFTSTTRRSADNLADATEESAMIRPAHTRVGAALRRSALIVAAGLWAFAGTNAHAQVFRCADADGHAVFSDRPCGTATEKVDVVDSSSGLSPISSDGLSAQEHTTLEAAAAADAQRADQSGQSSASPQGGSYTSTAASAQHRSY
jgi:Domain of unknown function (DUF4124)